MALYHIDPRRRAPRPAPAPSPPRPALGHVGRVPLERGLGAALDARVLVGRVERGGGVGGRVRRRRARLRQDQLLLGLEARRALAERGERGLGQRRRVERGRGRGRGRRVVRHDERRGGRALGPALGRRQREVEDAGVARRGGVRGGRQVQLEAVARVPQPAQLAAAARRARRRGLAGAAAVERAPRGRLLGLEVVVERGAGRDVLHARVGRREVERGRERGGGRRRRRGELALVRQAALEQPALAAHAAREELARRRHYAETLERARRRRYEEVFVVVWKEYVPVTIESASTI